MQHSKKAAVDKEGQRSLRRSSRSQVSVKKSYSEDEVHYSPNDISVKDCRFFLTWEKMFYSRSVVLYNSCSIDNSCHIRDDACTFQST